jgi:hypothetical protein
MPNEGVLDGLGPSLWRQYRPTIRGFSSAGTGITDPNLSDATIFAQYWTSGQGRVLYQGSIQFGTAGFGSGESVWGVSLPVPANRSSGGADLPIGNAWAWQGSSANPQLNMQMIPTLMDPLKPGGDQGQEDSFVQFFLPYMISYGTGTIATSATATTVTHNLGTTPAAYDIQITATNSPSTTPKIVYVTNVTDTTFDVNVVSSSATIGLTFAWKARCEPHSPPSPPAERAFSLLANHLRPWTWAATHVLAWQVEYEARR